MALNTTFNPLAPAFAPSMDFARKAKEETASDRINAHIDAALQKRNSEEKPRTYLGASRLGVECSRALQYEFTQTPKDAGREFQGKTLRIFAAGHVFEDLCIKWLKDAGFLVQTRGKDGKQFGFIAANGRLAGHCDGVIVDGPPGFAYPALWEAKSLNNKSWNDTVKHGLAKSKPIYAAQIATYQAYLNLMENPAIFTAINKDTAELYHELVPFDAALAQRMTDKAVRVIQATEYGELLPREYNDPTNFGCKFCDWKDRCWSV